MRVFGAGRLSLLPALAALVLLAAQPAPAQASTVCTLLMDAQSARILREDGDCHSRVTPASTFKLPLAVMAFDAGLLSSPQAPVMAFRPGDPDWGGANWTRDTNPADWMRYSVVWYSQRLTRALGADRLTGYAQGLGYGNADFSGDPGFDNGLERSWIASSLRVSPREQAGFLRRLVLETLPVSPQAMDQSRALVETWQVGDWTLHGKTGSAYPRRADRSFDYAAGWGWYVGWAQNAERTVIFVRLTQATARSAGSPGVLTRDAFLQDWPSLIAP